MEHALLVALKAFADPDRLRVLVHLADHESTEPEIARALGMPPSITRRHLGLLSASGLIERHGPAGADARYRVRIDGFHELGQRLAVAEGSVASGPGVGPAGESLPGEVARVLRGYFDDDRLTAIPANTAKRQVVLTYLRDRCFRERRAYPEKEVNQRLAVFHPDVAALRRYMVDGGLLTRAAGEYRLPADQPFADALDPAPE